MDIRFMKNLNTDYIRTNIFKLIDSVGISDISFAYILGISDKQLKRIKKQEADFTLENINKACDFFALSVSKLNSKHLKIDHRLREQLAVKHRNNTEYNIHINIKPSLPHAIKTVLLNDKTFREEGLTVSQIGRVFEKIGWVYSSSYISGSMSRNSDIIEIIGTKIVKGKKVNIYRARKL